MTLAELKAAIEAEALRRSVARDGFTLEAVQSFIAGGIAVPPAVRGLPPSPPDPLTYGYFASLDGRNFVCACYTALLGRNPDPGGLSHYLELLQAGRDKAFIVGAIAYSPEARKRNLRVAGLFPRFVIAFARRVPVAGALFGWLVELLSLHRRRRERQAFEQRVCVRLDAIADHLEQAGPHIASRLEAVRSALEARN